MRAFDWSHRAIFHVALKFCFEKHLRIVLNWLEGNPHQFMLHAFPHAWRRSHVYISIGLLCCIKSVSEEVHAF